MKYALYSPASGIIFNVYIGMGLPPSGMLSIPISDAEYAGMAFRVADYTVIDNKLTITTNQLDHIRLQRDYMLKASDAFMTSDFPIKGYNRDEWVTLVKAYRQQLRDFPAVCDQNNPAWPIEPDPTSPPATLDIAARRKIAEMELACYAAITGGFISSALGSLYQYDSGESDQGSLSFAYNATTLPAFDDPPYNGTLTIRCIPEGATEKVEMPHTKAQIQQMFADMLVHLNTQKRRLWDKENTIKALYVTPGTTPDQIEAVTWE